MQAVLEATATPGLVSLDMSLESPMVTVLIAAWNAEDFMQQCLDSILDQTFQDFEIVIVDDGSTDCTSQIVRQNHDTRIRLVTLDANLGISAALNHGISIARGKYLARLDADDLALPDRLERQVSFLEENPHVIAVGGSMLEMHHGEIVGQILVEESPRLNCRLALGNQLKSSTVTMRMEALAVHHIQYDPAFANAQDYEIWTRLAAHGHLANQSELISVYRRHNNQQTTVHFARQVRLGVLAQYRYLRRVSRDGSCSFWLLVLGYGALSKNSLLFGYLSLRQVLAQRLK